MGKRSFRLPGEEDLNKDQDRVLALPEDGQFLVVGGPGTGKSVVALLRAMKYKNNNKFVFLVYNKVLKELSKQLLNTQSNKYLTILHWFYYCYEKLTNDDSPKLYKNGYPSPDYDKIIKIFSQLNVSQRPLHIIIDEGQDMPYQFYEALQYMGYEHFFIVADQNQQITENNSSRQELTEVLGLDVSDVIELTTNYRNSSPIALFARHFYTDKASPPPELPKRTSLDTPIFYKNLARDVIFEMIVRESDKDDRKLIGIVVADETNRITYLEGIKSTEVELDNPFPALSSYSSRQKDRVSIDFSQGGIVVLNDKSIKGLEFDIVYIVLDGFKIFNNETDNMKKRLYVMGSRAIEKLVLVSTQKNPAITDLLPSDNTVLKIVDDSVTKVAITTYDDVNEDVPF